MVHNVCCDSYHVYNVTYLLHYCTYSGVKYVTWDHCSMIGLLVVMSIVVVLALLLLSFLVVGGWGGAPVRLFFVVCYCFLFWIGCVLYNWFLCETVTVFFRVVMGGLLSLCSFPFLRGWMASDSKNIKKFTYSQTSSWGSRNRKHA